MVEIVICDDDIGDLNHASDMMHEIFDNQNISYHIKTFLSAGEMLKNVNKIDIGILDIAMEGMDGLEAGRRLKKKFPNVKLIYTTSYEDYCMRAVNEVHAFSFLCKPLDSGRIQEQITEALSGSLGIVMEKEFYKVTDSRKKEYFSMKFCLKDILYIEYIKRQRRAAIVLEDETYECECVFEKLVEELRQYDFAVNRRGVLVNLIHVQRMKGHILYLDNGEQLAIAQKRILDFRMRMNEFLQQNS